MACVHIIEMLGANLSKKVKSLQKKGSL
jgi:hypothetical protein